MPLRRSSAPLPSRFVHSVADAACSESSGRANTVGMSALPTLAAWIDEWLALQRTRIEPVSWRTYRQMADAYLLPTPR